MNENKKKISFSKTINQILAIAMIVCLIIQFNTTVVWAAKTKVVLVSKIATNTSQLNLDVNGTYFMRTTVLPQNATIKTIAYTSSNKAIAKVDSKGTITAVAPGSCTVTAKATDKSGKSVAIKVIVFEPLSAWDNDELAKAITLGIVPKTMQGNYHSSVTEKELYTLLFNCINLRMGKVNNNWLTLFNRASSSKILLRKDAADIIYKAAKNGLGIKEANSILTIIRTGNGYFKDNYFGDEYNAMLFVNAQFDYTSSSRVMETTPDNYFRINDKLTRVEAISAAYRLYNSILPSPDYVPMDKIDRLAFSPDQIERSKSMPAATVQKLPDWRGFNFVNKSSTGPLYTNYANTNMYTEQDIKNISELGFNFVRVQLNYNLICKSDDDSSVDMVQLENIDNLVKWGIKYKVHICFNGYQFPGYPADGSSTKEKFFKSEKDQDIAADFLAMLARRYADLPNNVVSFNLLNEPIMTTKETYVKVIGKLSSAIRKVTPDRLIIADGYILNNLYVAGEPLKEIADMGIVQSMHYYIPDFLCFALFNNSGYAPQNWPIPYVNGLVWGSGKNKGDLSVQGKFSAGTEVTIRVASVNGNGDVVIKADGNEVMRKSLKNHKAGENGCTSLLDSNTAFYNLDYTVKLPDTAQKLEVVWDGGEWLKVSNITIKHPETTDVKTPYLGSASDSFNVVKFTTNNVITNILCTRGETDIANSTVTVAQDGTYENFAQKNLELNIQRMREFVKTWSDFSKQTGTAVMCQEFGICNNVSEKASLSWMEDWLKVMTENNIPWATMGYREQFFGILNSNRIDVKYEKYGPYLLDREMLKLLQKYQ